MTLSITINGSPHVSDDSSVCDEEDSSDVQASPPPSEPGSRRYRNQYSEWPHLPYPDELKPSDSASRQRTAHQSRHPTYDSRPRSNRRRLSRRPLASERETHPRKHRPPSPDSPESADSADEYPANYYRAPERGGFWPNSTQDYARSSSPGPSYMFPHRPGPNGAFRHPNGPHVSDELIRLGHHSQPSPSVPYDHILYGYGSQFQHPHGAPVPPFFAHGHPHGSRAMSQQGLHHTPNEMHSLSQRPNPHALPHHIPAYDGHTLSPHELLPYTTGGYYHFRDPYAIPPPGMIPSPYFGRYPREPSPPQVEPSSPMTSAADPAKDEAIARLEKLILEERSEREAREAREAARQEALQLEAAERAAEEERAAHDKKIAEEAAATARAEAEEKAAQEVAKAKEDAEKAAAVAVAEAAAEATAAATAAAEEAAAAAAAAAVPPPPEKRKPVKFKDAVGRKFSFPFELCCTWQGMEELIRQAFLHIEVIGPHVAEGHYDLVGPNGDIILPQVWETVIEPDWTITMHMWPIPEKPKSSEPEPSEPAPAPEPAPVPPPDPAVSTGDEVNIVAPKKPAPKKPRVKASDPGPFTMWMVGSNRARLNRSLNAKKA